MVKHLSFTRLSGIGLLASLATLGLGEGTRPRNFNVGGDDLLSFPQVRLTNELLIANLYADFIRTV